MTGVRLRGTPAVPWLSAFPELNVRTYVTCGRKPGVWFFSLDASSALAVAAARAAYKLPYFHSHIDFVASNDPIPTNRDVRLFRLCAGAVVKRAGFDDNVKICRSW